MITVKTMTNGDIFRESDSGYYIQREDGVLFSSARDKADTRHIYTETTELIPTQEETAE